MECYIIKLKEWIYFVTHTQRRFRAYRSTPHFISGASFLSVPLHLSICEPYSVRIIDIIRI